MYSIRLKPNIIKHIMLDKRIKLTDLQKWSGLSRATLSAISNGKTCKYATVKAIAEALEVDVEELIESRDRR